ncbi:LysR substrate-binding domain-containing protein [Agrobacterium tumefaciens]|uniref:LysR substrate-binding domain-containing protein n=1 Tax=Agrobacterium tumefaciens TaxID=358 RepID=UPI001571C24C|nr:hypothetical protein [Agrobacterium tumefaciens]
MRIGCLPDSNLSAVKVGSVRRVMCGSPKYFERYGVPRLPDDLKDHRIAASTAAWASPEWKFGKDLRISVNAALQCNTNDAAIQSAREGWGLTRVLNYQIGPALVAGELQIVLSEFESRPCQFTSSIPKGGMHRQRSERLSIWLRSACVRTAF